MSSIEKSESTGMISVLLSSPYLSFISNNSVFMISIRWFLLSRIPFKWAMCFINSLYSSTTFSISNPVNLWRRMSNIACACMSERLKLFINPSLACVGSLLPRITLITSSMLSSAIFKPSSMCARASASFRSNFVRRTIISWRKSTK